MYIETNTTNVPDERGYFGEFGGRFVPETLIPALDELTAAYHDAMADPDFRARLTDLNRTYVGRPTPVTFAARLTETLGGAQIYLKREDLAHTGAHKINNALGQALLAKRLGARRIVAETGAGQHGVASAAACARLGIHPVRRGKYHLGNRGLDLRIDCHRALAVRRRRAQRCRRLRTAARACRSAAGSPQGALAHDPG